MARPGEDQGHVGGQTSFELWRGVDVWGDGSAPWPRSEFERNPLLTDAILENG